MRGRERERQRANENKIINRSIRYILQNSSYFPFLLPSVKDIFRSMDVVNVRVALDSRFADQPSSRIRVAPTVKPPSESESLANRQWDIDIMHFFIHTLRVYPHDAASTVNCRYCSRQSLDGRC